MHDEAASPTAQRREQIAGELAEWMHAAAREAQRRLMEAETTEDFATLAATLAKLARGVRQSLALQAKFEAERLKGERAVRLEAEIAASSAVSWKKARIRTAVERVVWNERDDVEDEEDLDEAMEEVDARLDRMAGAEGFMETPDEPLIGELCEAFGLKVPDAVVRALALVAQADTPRPGANGHDERPADSS
jgi:hypothetical protein